MIVEISFTVFLMLRPSFFKRVQSSGDCTDYASLFLRPRRSPLFVPCLSQYLHPKYPSFLPSFLPSFIHSFLYSSSLFFFSYHCATVSVAAEQLRSRRNLASGASDAGRYPGSSRGVPVVELALLHAFNFEHGHQPGPRQRPPSPEANELENALHEPPHAGHAA